MTHIEATDTGETLEIPTRGITMEALRNTVSTDLDSLPLDGNVLRDAAANKSIGDCVSLTELWAQVLQIQQNTIDQNDNFFQLGGDSLAAIRLANAALEAGFTLPVEQIFLYPVLNQMAQLPYNLSQPAWEKDIAPFSLIASEVDLEQCISDVARICGVEAGCIEDIYPTTTLQEGLLSLTAKNPGDYILQSVMDLTAEVDMDRFQKAWKQTCRAIPILRTRIVEHDTLGSLQVVLDEDIWWYTSEDFDKYVLDDTTKGMNPGKPLARYALIHNDKGSVASFVWTLHHALYDRVALHEMQNVFSQYYHGNTIKELPAFKTYVGHLLHRSQVSALAFWEWATLDFESETFPTLPAGVTEGSPDSSLSRKITMPKNMATSNITAAMLIRAAWALVVNRNTGADDVVFGATLSGRNAPVPGLDNMIGPTIATVPVRIRVSSETTIAEYLEGVQEQAADMMPFEHTGLQNIARINKEAQQACSFQTALTVQYPSDGLSDDSNTIGIWRKTPQVLETATYPLVIVCTLEQNDVDVVANVDSRVLEEWKVEKMLAQLEHTVIQLTTSSPDTKLDQLNRLTPSDLETIWKWNKSVPSAVEETLHGMVMRKGREQPDAVAIDAWDGQVTYSELEGMTTRLARHLVAQGVSKGNLVPLFFEKSKCYIIATLAVLKAGGAFVPLDPDHGADRRDDILRQIDAQIALASERHSGILFNSDTKVVPLSLKLLEELDNSDCETLELPSASPRDSAYAIFTSGSTGTPKGVIVEHQAITTSSTYHGRLMDFNSKTRVMQFSNFAFDASIGDIFTTMIAGGTVCMATNESLRNDLAGCIRTMQANTILITPSVARLIHPDEVPSLTNLTFGGETPLQEDIEQWKHITLSQVYGPTECAVLSTFGYMDDAQDAHDQTRDIGRATGSVAWIVDPNDHSLLVPVGATGELLLEGPIVATGYLNDPAKTASVFIEDPEWLKKGGPDSPGRGGRMYKTGDLVQYGADGRLLYVGRKDTQVKVRGQRLELEGVEHHILQSFAPNAKHVVAEVLHEQGAGAGAVLAAFVVLDQELANNGTGQTFEGVGIAAFTPIAAVEDQLARNLPSYSIPTVWYTIDQLPLSLSGKTDRKKLRAAGSAYSKSELANGDVRQKKRLAPRTEAEQILVRLCAQVLGLQESQIGVEDNFFRLGGDSIMAMKLVGTTRKAGHAITVALIFQHPRLADLASVMRRINDDVNGDVEDIPPFSLLPEVDSSVLREQVAQICRVDLEAIIDAYPCTPLQEGLLALSSVQTGDYVLQSVLELSPSTNETRLRAVWETAVRDLAILRSRIVQHLTLGLIQVVIDQSVEWQIGDNLEMYLKDDKALPMSPGGPLARYGMVDDKATGNKYLVVTVHHALYDGESWSMVQEHFSSLFTDTEATFEHHPSFSRVVKSIMDTDTSVAQAFWQESFHGLQGMTFPSLPSGNKTIVADTTIRSDAFSLYGKPDVTIASIVRAAWALAVHQYTGSNDVVFGALLSGRNMAVSNMDRIVGPTIATVPVRVRIPSNDSSAGAFLQEIQDGATAMIPFEQTGLQHIAKLSMEAQQACSFQTLLVVNGARPVEDKNKKNHSFGRWLQMFQIKEFISYAVTINCNISSSGIIALECSFDSSFIEHWKMQNMLDHTRLLIQKLATAAIEPINQSRPETKLGDLKCLISSDHKQIWQWNSIVPASVDQCVHDIIQEQMELNLEAPAVHSWDGNLTYDELDKFSKSLAHQLKNQGIGEDSYVLLCFEKSMWTVVAQLAVLRAGGAFVMVEPSLPKHRVLSIIRQTGSTLALTSTNAKIAIASLVTATIVVDDTLLVMEQSTDPLPSVLPSSIAYVPFTSGTTGEPKGSLIPHSAFASAIHYQARRLTCENARVFDFASYSFDGCVQNSLMTLAVGGCVCIPSESDRKDNLTTVIATMEVNCMLLTPSVARLVDFERLPLLKQLNLGGEAIRATDIARVPERIRIVNNYGPSECTVNSVINDCQSPRDQIHLLGTGAGAVTWVVDPENHECLLPIGAVGELLLEGPIVGRGYVGNHEKTSTSFIDAPAWLGRGGKLYKTGDLVQYNEDGVLSYVGRKDSQVKIRGQRIELGEVEHHVLACLSDAREVVADVLHPKDEDSSATLAAFVLLHEDEQADTPHLFAVPRSLEDDLAERVPSYMIPTIWIAVSDWPLTVNSKIDRKALRELGSSFSKSQLAQLSQSISEDKQYPTTEAEILLSQLFTRVLRLESDIIIGVEDSFLRLGGDSITAMQISAEARARGLNVSTADILRHKTIAAILDTYTERSNLTARIGATDEDQESDSAGFGLTGAFMSGEDLNLFKSETLPRIGNDLHFSDLEDIFPCSPMQEGILIGQAKDSSRYRSRIDVELRLPGGSKSFDTTKLQWAWQQVLSRHPLLRAVLVKDFPGSSRVMHVILKAPASSISIENQLDNSSLSEYLNSSRNGYGEFDLQHRLSLHQLSSGGMHLVLELNHAIVDGHSTFMLMEELVTFYNGGTNIAAPKSYRELVSYIDSKSPQEGISYWASRLNDVESCHFPGLDDDTVASKELVEFITVPDIDTKQLRTFCAEHELTPAILIQVAWAMVLKSYTGIQQPSFGVICSGRDHPIDRIDNIFGPMMGMITACISLGSDASVMGALKAAQLDYLVSLEHQTVPLAAVHSALGLGTSALFNTVLSFQKVASDTVGDVEKGLSLQLVNEVDPSDVSVYYPSLSIVDSDFPALSRRNIAKLCHIIGDANSTTRFLTFIPSTPFLSESSTHAQRSRS
jgi:amino acid adenylation domain-containing protein